MNARAVIGHNGGPALEEDSGPRFTDAELEGITRAASVEYNSAGALKKEANAVIREERKAYQVSNAAAYEAVEAIMSSAREKLKGDLRERPAYAEAEEQRRDAAARQKAVIKMLKDKGIDPAAFKIANRMGAEMDQQERQDFFDMIDQICKVRRYW